MDADGCPFHDLPSGTVVHLHYGPHVIPRSVELCCEDYHDARALAPFFERALAEAFSATLGNLDDWRPTGLRTSPPEDPWRIDRALFSATERAVNACADQPARPWPWQPC